MKKSFGEELLEGMQELTEALEARPDVSDEFTVRRIKLELKPETYSPAMIVQTRKLLGASQAVFAVFIGVSVKTLQAWEQGVNPIKGTAARLLDEIRHNPKLFRKRLKSLSTPRVTGKGPARAIVKSKKGSTE